MSNDDLDQSVSGGARCTAVDVSDATLSDDEEDAGSLADATETSWYTRLGRAMVGVFVGTVLIVAGMILLAWNESRSVTTARSLEEGRGAAVDVFDAVPVPLLDGRLVHVSGSAATTAPIIDSDFSVSARALALARRVEMFQWEQHEESTTQKQPGGGETTTKTYSYSKVWSSRPIDSSGFRQPLNHVNPAFAVDSRTITARDASLGGYTLPEMLLAQLTPTAPVVIDPAVLPRLQSRFGSSVTQVDNALFVGANSAVPQIGDMRISYTMVPVGDLTVVAAQKGDGFDGYRTNAGDTIAAIRIGRLGLAEMFSDLEEENAIRTWGLRGGGAIAVLVGFVLVLAPLSIFADLIPVLGPLVGFGSFLLALSLTLVIAPLTVAIAWVAFRPLFAIGVLAAGTALAGGLGSLASLRRRSAEPLTPVAQLRT